MTRDGAQNPSTKRATAAGAVVALLGLVVAAVLAGCGDPLAHIDKRARTIIESRAAALGDDTLAPTRSTNPPYFERDTVTDRDPATVNPDADALAYDRLTEDRDDREVAERLSEYADFARGEGPSPSGDQPPPTLELTLAEVFRLAQSQAPEYLFEEEAYVLDAIRVLQARNNFRTRFFNETSVQLDGFGREGNFDHTLNIINNFGLGKNLPGGGRVAASWITRATDQLRERVTGSYVQSSELLLTADIPLLRGAGTVAREGLIQAERDLVYSARAFERSRRELLVNIADNYFRLIQQKARLGNLRRQLESLTALAESTAAKVEAGRLEPFQKQLSANQVLRAEASLADERERYIFALDTFKIRLGIPVETPINLAAPDLDLPEPDVTLTAATDSSLSFRLDLQNERDRINDAKRAVRNARNGLLPDLDVAGSVGIPTEFDDPTGGFSIDPDDLTYSLSATLGLPLDRRAEKLTLRSAIILLERAERNLRVFTDGVIIAARQAVRQIELARFQLQLAERGVVSNELRLVDLGLRDNADPQRVVDAENELIEARNARDQARTDLRNAILEYLLATGQLRVAKNGSLLALPGMADANAAADDLPGDAATPDA